MLLLRFGLRGKGPSRLESGAVVTAALGVTHLCVRSTAVVEGVPLLRTGLRGRGLSRLGSGIAIAVARRVKHPCTKAIVEVQFLDSRCVLGRCLPTFLFLILGAARRRGELLFELLKKGLVCFPASFEILAFFESGPSAALELRLWTLLAHRCTQNYWFARHPLLA